MSDTRLPIVQPEGNVPESARVGGEEKNVPVMLSRLDESISFFEKNLSNALGWARKFSLFQYPFVTACCGMEFMSRRGAASTTSRASAPSSRASRRARPTC